MGDHAIHWKNNTPDTLWATAYHDAIKRRYYGVKVDPGGTGVPYIPHFQSYEYTIRFYDSKDDKKLCEYQYVCVEAQSYLVTVSKDASGAYDINVSPYPPITKRRPAYLIAHRQNDKGDIAGALQKGANAIECDVRVKDNEWYVDHDGVYAWSTKLSDWLVQAADCASSFGQAFALIVFDIKTPEKLASLRSAVRAALPADLNTIFSIADYSDRNAFAEIAGDLKPNEGLAIDAHNSPSEVEDYFNCIGVSQYWYGNGIFTGGIGPHVYESLVKACGLRDEGKGIKKAYVWTLAKDSSIRDYLYSVGVDGVMVNPSTLADAKAIMTAPDSRDRMATRADPPFVVFKA